MICIRSHFKILFNSALLRSYPFTEDWQPNLLKLETLTTNQPAKTIKTSSGVYFFSYLLRTVWQNRSVNPHRHHPQFPGRTDSLAVLLLDFPCMTAEDEGMSVQQGFVKHASSTYCLLLKAVWLTVWLTDWLAGWLVGGFWLGISIMLPSE